EGNNAQRGCGASVVPRLVCVSWRTLLSHRRKNRERRACAAGKSCRKIPGFANRHKVTCSGKELPRESDFFINSPTKCSTGQAPPRTKKMTSSPAIFLALRCAAREPAARGRGDFSVPFPAVETARATTSRPLSGLH